MILSDSTITKLRAQGDIVVEPWDPQCLGPNSYDMHLSPHLACYVPDLEGWLGREPWCLDAAAQNQVSEFQIPEKGLVLQPGRLYLASTLEYTETRRALPYLDGKSSVARLGIQVHLTAGRGDVGFCGHWTLEISVVQPVRVYAGMPIAQLTWHLVTGNIDRPYGSSPANRGNYNQRDPRPQASRMWRHFTEPAVAMGFVEVPAAEPRCDGSYDDGVMPTRCDAGGGCGRVGCPSTPF